MVEVQVLPAGGGAWAVSVRGGGAPVVRVVSAREVAAARAACAALYMPPGLGRVGHDGALVAAEDAAGEILGGLLFGPEQALVAGAALVAGPRVLVIDGAPELPWEILHLPGAGPAEEVGIPVVRRVAAPPWARPVAVPAGAAVWCRTRDARVRRMADRLAGGRALEHLTAVPPVRALVVVGHGAVGHWLTDGGGDLAAGTAAHALGARGDGIVVALTCDGATHDAGASLADRLVGAGVRACLAPDGRVPVDVAAEVGLAALPPEPTLSLVASARRRVRSLASPSPAARWWRWRLVVGDLRALGSGVGAEAGWPEPEPVLAGRLKRAVDESGFLGLEAMILAVGGAWAAWWAPHLTGRLRALAPAPGVPRPPRAARVAALLSPCFDAEALGQALTSELGREPSLGGVTWSSGPPGGPAAALEVVGGPEDGRRIELRPGQVVGRADPDEGPDVPLFDRVGLVDPRLSRRHLMWTGVGRVTFLRPGRVGTGGALLDRESADVGVGTWVELSRGTLLRGVS